MEIPAASHPPDAAFVDEFDAVVTCGIIGEPGPDSGTLARGTVQLQSAAPDAQPIGVCPVRALLRSRSGCTVQARYETRPVRGWATRKCSGCTCPGTP
jgi:hypothetical protein